MKRTVTALFAVFALMFGAQTAFAEPNDPGGTPGKSPYHKTHGDQSDHGKPVKGGGKGLGHCKHDPDGCNGSNGGDPGDNGDNGNGDNGDNGNGDNAPGLANTGV